MQKSFEFKTNNKHKTKQTNKRNKNNNIMENDGKLCKQKDFFYEEENEKCKTQYIETVIYRI